MSPQSLRAKFTDGGLETASPAKVVVMAYDRLDRDLAGALVALESRDIERSHELLVHAQDLVHELLCMLDLDVWEHAPKLASIYQYVNELLTTANVRKSTAEANEARTLLAGLGDAFRQAAAQSAVRPAATPARGADPAPRPARTGALAAPMFDSSTMPARQFSVRA
jgi:flagellar secretion chaperone FliS